VQHKKIVCHSATIENGGRQEFVWIHEIALSARSMHRSEKRFGREAGVARPDSSFLPS
jgi:hypothetical protein